MPAGSLAGADLQGLASRHVEHGGADEEIVQDHVGGLDQPEARTVRRSGSPGPAPTRKAAAAATVAREFFDQVLRRSRGLIGAPASASSPEPSKKRSQKAARSRGATKLSETAWRRRAASSTMRETGRNGPLEPLPDEAGDGRCEAARRDRDDDRAAVENGRQDEIAEMGPVGDVDWHPSRFREGGAHGIGRLAAGCIDGNGGILEMLAAERAVGAHHDGIGESRSEDGLRVRRNEPHACAGPAQERELDRASSPSPIRRQTRP